MPDMLDPQDFKQIRVIIKEEVRGEIEAAEKRLQAQIESSGTKILTEVGNFISDQVLTQLEEKADKSDIERLERKMDKVSEKVLQHDQDIHEIKGVLGIQTEG